MSESTSYNNPDPLNLERYVDMGPSEADIVRAKEEREAERKTSLEVANAAIAEINDVYTKFFNGDPARAENPDKASVIWKGIKDRQLPPVLPTRMERSDAVRAAVIRGEMENKPPYWFADYAEVHSRPTGDTSPSRWLVELAVFPGETPLDATEAREMDDQATSNVELLRLYQRTGGDFRLNPQSLDELKQILAPFQTPESAA